MKLEKRTLYEKIFGKKKPNQKSENTYLKMLNSYTPFYTSIGKNYNDFFLIKTCINTIATHRCENASKTHQKFNW